MEYTEYTIDDLSEYDTFLTRILVDKSEFIECLNVVTSPNSQLCDFNAMLSNICDVSNYTFIYIKTTLKKDPIYYHVWYFYFKFLLLDDVPKDIFYTTYIKKLLSINSIFNINRTKENWDDILQLFYELVNDDTLTNFMDCYDNTGQYKRLDISKKSNIVYKRDIYIDNYVVSDGIKGGLEFCHYMQYCILNYDNVHFCYNLIYSISDKYGYEKIENSNGFLDFSQRFYSNIDKFIIAWNAMTITYYKLSGKNKTESKVERIIQNIPTCRRGVIKRTGHNVMVLIEESDKYKVINELFRDILLSTSYTFDRKYKEQFLFYLTKVLKYDIDEDKYKLYYYKFSINNYYIELETRYKNTSFLNRLQFINDKVYTRLIDNSDKILEELKTFIERIFVKFNYHKLIIL